MPMHVTYFDMDEYDGYEDAEQIVDSREAVAFAPQIIAALAKEHESIDSECGLMEYYREEDGVNEKVQSYTFEAEVRDGRLWGVAKCYVRGELTPEEKELLIRNVSGQASDGFGEGFEQREISVGSGIGIYAHLWNSENWSIMPESERFDPEFEQKLPDICWSVLPSDGSLICIKRGEMGYYPSEWSSGNPDSNRHRAEYNNRVRGITPAQEQAMVGGSMFGWNSPAADPRSYERISPGHCKEKMKK